MVLRFCQLKSLSLLLLIMLMGCSRLRPEPPKLPPEYLAKIEPAWFSKNLNHSLLDGEERPRPHLFFDVTPEMSKDERFVNVVIVTPEDSPYAYKLDVTSGQRYYAHSYCSQKDVWNHYSGSVNRPTFALANLPGVLDQSGEPQKVIVFGGKDHFAKLIDDSHRVKLVGSFVEQICAEGNCTGGNKWLSRLVLIAVDIENPLSESISDPESFQKNFDWKLAQATLENMDGRNGLGHHSFPALRIGKLIPLSESMSYLKKHSIQLSGQESRNIQKSCHALYEKLWKEVGKDADGFSARVTLFTKQYYKEISTCERFVYHGNVNLDPKKFWFLSYMGIFYRLNKDGFYFDCKGKSWQENGVNVDGAAIFDLRRDIGKCTDQDIDLAMEHLHNFLLGLKLTDSHFYKFIDYDTHTFGTHQKLYSWVKMPSKKFDCSVDPNELIKKETSIFPEDVSWTPRSKLEGNPRTKIIR